MGEIKMKPREQIEALRALEQKVTPDGVALTAQGWATVITLLNVVEAQHKALQFVADLTWPVSEARKAHDTARAALALMEKEEA